MNQQIKQQWIEALRSGAYKKCRHYLHRTNGAYCAIGVLCELHSQSTGKAWELYEAEQHYLYYEEGGNAAPEVRDWAGLTKAEMNAIILCNDGTGGFYSVIAYIERTL